VRAHDATHAQPARESECQLHADSDADADANPHRDADSHRVDTDGRADNVAPQAHAPRASAPLQARRRGRADDHVIGPVHQIGGEGVVSAFSNGYECDRWSARWCETCAKDSLGLPATAPEVFCPIVGSAMMDGPTPPEWVENESGGLETRYTCTDYEPRVGEPDARTLAGPDAMRSTPAD
jgi:hypothetical protein